MTNPAALVAFRKLIDDGEIRGITGPDGQVYEIIATAEAAQVMFAHHVEIETMDADVLHAFRGYHLGMWNHLLGTSDLSEVLGEQELAKALKNIDPVPEEQLHAFAMRCDAIAEFPVIDESGKEFGIAVGCPKMQR